MAAPGAALVRGNLAWWRGTDPVYAAVRAGRWVGDVRDGAIGRFVDGRLVPAALAAALAGLRDPEGRTEADVVVGGGPGRSFARGGLRLVVGPDGAPLALTAPLGVPGGGTTVGFRAGPALDDTDRTATLSLAPPAPADGDTVRRAAARPRRRRLRTWTRPRAPADPTRSRSSRRGPSAAARRPAAPSATASSTAAGRRPPGRSWCRSTSRSSRSCR